MVGGCKDEACSQGLDVEPDFDLVILDSFFTRSALRVRRGLNPMRSVPDACLHEACLEVCLLRTGCCLALVVGNGDAPIVTCLSSRREAFCLDEHALVGVDVARFPDDIAESCIVCNLNAVRRLHHASLFALKLPGEVNTGLVDANRIVIVLSTEPRNIECICRKGEKVKK